MLQLHSERFLGKSRDATIGVPTAHIVFSLRVCYIILKTSLKMIALLWHKKRVISVEIARFFVF
ncbi:hypothetical protein BKL49_00555 [Rodentibacter myodis]|uniref:Uncharacterized protein n=1 Tax=Rodentibacter myodis TaxID=1907939 RepID=A0A1V3JTU7_9PAST|nr:hypothetical protein BKL49_00555 [Rodentibacter myodis]